MRQTSTHLTFVLVIMAGLLSCKGRYTDVSVATTAAITRDWTEFKPATPLRWERPEQEFTFHIDSPHSRSVKAEIVVPDGQAFVPEVEFVTSGGLVISADAHGFLGEDMYFASSKGGMEPIGAIRMRSKVPLQISNLRWRGYDPSQVKR